MQCICAEGLHFSTSKVNIPKVQGRTLDYGTFKPTMFASSVQAVVACNVTARRVCTLMLFIFS